MTATEQEPLPSADPGEDGVFFDATHGKVLLRINGAEWWLRRPTFGEFRRASEAVEAIGAPAPKKAGAKEPLRDPVLSVYVTAVKPRFGWWRMIVDALSDRPLPQVEGKDTDPDDDLPYWLASADLINDVMQHWLSVPRVAPGV